LHLNAVGVDSRASPVAEVAQAAALLDPRAPRPFALPRRDAELPPPAAQVVQFGWRLARRARRKSAPAGPV